MEQYKVIIFDLDGVLIKTDEFHTEAWKKMCKEFKLLNQKINFCELRGISRVDSLNKILEKQSMHFNTKQKEEMLKYKNDIYVSLLEDNIRPIQRINILLEKLLEKQYILTVASSSKNAELVLNKMGIKKYFELIITGNMITKSKPNPEIYEKIVEHYNYKLEQYLVIEDSVAGIQAATQLGIDTIYLNKDSKNCTKKYEINDLMQLYEILQ